MSEQAPKVKRRKALRRQDARALMEEAAKFGVPPASKVEEAQTEDGTQVYLLDDEILLFRSVDGNLYPTLRCPCVDRLPAVVVDMGAIPFVCKGADVMAPGITEIRTPFDEGAIVVVRDVKHGKALSIGKALRASASIIAEKKGKVIQNLHYVGDKVWSSVA